MKVLDILEGKSEEEIRCAATWWFIATDCYLRGEKVPGGVFAISTKRGLTRDDVAWAYSVICQDRSLTGAKTDEEFDEIIERFIETNKPLFEDVNMQEYMDRVRERG